MDKVTGEYTPDHRKRPHVPTGMTTGSGTPSEVDPDLEAALKPYETATWQDYMLQPIGKATGNFTAANLGTAPSAFVDHSEQGSIWGAMPPLEKIPR